MKERLTGAIILVALLVLLVPELLTGPSSKSTAKPAGEENAPLRSYTIDLADDPARRATTNPTPAPETAVTDEPVAQAESGADASGEATAGEDAATTEGADASPPEQAADGGTPTDLGVAHGSSADPAAAARAERGSDARSNAARSAGPATEPRASAAAKPAAVEPERPHSAFGPGAAAQAQPPKPAPSAASARSESSGSAEPSRPAAKPATSAGGWSVQLGAFGSRDNAERLMKQVKGKGFPAAINENASSKLRYRVRVGPEKDRAAAEALVAKLRAAGQKDATVVPP